MRRLILASLAMAALASCSKESSVDVAITSAQIPIQYSAYAGSSVTTKGAPINTNTVFSTSGEAFEVSAYAALTGISLGKYFDFSTVTHNGSTWGNTDATYWPNTSGTLYFGAYYPSGSTRLTNGAYSYASDNHSLSFDYTVIGDVYAADDATTGTVNYHEDVMYAVTSLAYTAPDNGEDDDVDLATKVNLHFKHALTQVAFTATKDSNLDVVVKSITICNVLNSGTFKATSVTDTSAETTADGTVENKNVETADMGSWTQGTTYSHYIAALDLGDGETSITVAAGDDATILTDNDNALMLIPQDLTAWDPTDGKDVSSNAYLAIDCTVKHTGADVAIIDGIVFVPFSTDGIDYTDNTIAVDGTWAPGYKITYNLVFGGGYTYPDDSDPDIPTPGSTPDPDDVVPTLRAITYTTTVDEWIPTTGGNVTIN